VVSGILMLWLCVSLIPSRPSQLRSQNYPQLRSNMTQAEVEALLGGPPGNYGRYSEKRSIWTAENGSGPPPGGTYRTWTDDTNSIEVSFDVNGRLYGCHKRSSYTQYPSPFEWLRDWPKQELLPLLPKL
jgi:hypothetical protein